MHTSTSKLFDSTLRDRSYLIYWIETSLVVVADDNDDDVVVVSAVA